MIWRCARNLLAFVAFLGLLPGFNLVVEQLAELVQHGHLAHTVRGEADPLGEEHGCNPIEHHCPCHRGGQSAELGRLVDGGTVAPLWLTWMIDFPDPRRRHLSQDWPRATDRLVASRSTAPPTPPPNA